MTDSKDKYVGSEIFYYYPVVVLLFRSSFLAKHYGQHSLDQGKSYKQAK